MSKERDLGREWFELGLKNSGDPFVKFIMHWIAFNWLYNFHDDKREVDKIRSFCKHYISTLRKYDAYSTEEVKLFLEKPIMNGHTGCIEKPQENRYNQILNSKSIPHLIETLYQVRCNLFHGSKSSADKRDVDVVTASSVLLEGYLKVYFEEKNETPI